MPRRTPRATHNPAQPPMLLSEWCQHHAVRQSQALAQARKGELRIWKQKRRWWVDPGSLKGEFYEPVHCHGCGCVRLGSRFGDLPLNWIEAPAAFLRCPDCRDLSQGVPLASFVAHDTLCLRGSTQQVLRGDFLESSVTRPRMRAALPGRRRRRYAVHVDLQDPEALFEATLTFDVAAEGKRLLKRWEGRSRILWLFPYDAEPAPTRRGHLVVVPKPNTTPRPV